MRAGWGGDGAKHNSKANSFSSGGSNWSWRRRRRNWKEEERWALLLGACMDGGGGTPGESKNKFCGN